jgi:hypothetical protein
MALATHTPSTWTELLASTMHNIRGSFADNIFRKRPLLEHLLSAGRVRILDGGISIVEPLLYADGDSDSYSEWQAITVTPVNTLTAAQFAWKQMYATIAISGLEEAQNSGREQIINVLETKIEQAEMSLRSKLNRMAYGTYASATPANDWNALTALIDSTTPTGGIDPATEAWWASYEAAVGAVDAAGLETAMRTAYLTTSDSGGDTVDAIFTDQATYAFYESTLTPQVRYTDTNKANLGFRNLMFENVPVMFDQDCPAGTMFGINGKYCGAAIHKDRNFVTSAFSDNLSGSVTADATAGVGLSSASAMDARVAFITAYGNFTIRNRRRCFKLTGITKAP